MAKVFKVTPKRIKRSNGLVLTPDMSVIVTTQQHMSSPFNNGAKELKEVYMRIYGFDYQKACCQGWPLRSTLFFIILETFLQRR